MGRINSDIEFCYWMNGSSFKIHNKAVRKENWKMHTLNQTTRKSWQRRKLLYPSEKKTCSGIVRTYLKSEYSYNSWLK